MQPFRYHVFACAQQKPDGVPWCHARGSEAVLLALRREIGARGLADQVQVTQCGSIGLCENGPNLVVYPEGVWYSGVRPEDAAEIVESHFRNGVPVARLARHDEAATRAEIEGNWGRYLASLRAKEASGALPDEWNERMRAFQESRTILTAIELDAFSALGDGATAGEAASRMSTDVRATEMLLNALAAIGLVTKQDGVFRNGPVAARHFRGEARNGFLHSAHMWETWSRLTESVKSGGGWQAEAPAPPDWTDAFIAAMHRNASERAGGVVRAVDAGTVRRMLDIGGGSGAYSIAFAQANPELRADILDLPEVGPIARRHIEAAGVTDGVHWRQGDLRNDSLGEGYDLVLLSAICHMLSEEENRDLFRRAQAALAPGGRIVISDFLLEPDKTAPKFAALFSLNMLVGTRAGASYSEAEYASWLSEAGFGEVRRVRLPGPAGLMVGTRMAEL
jgi:(2Fe-2S) ferredoxin/predicted O-methyltransferase YrrM